MEQIIEFFQKLFQTSDWPPRWICGKWTDFHGWLYIGSDLTIWLAYFAIPVILVYFIQRNKNLPFLPVFWLFVGFILLCGSTHAMDAIIFYWPAYRLSALLRCLTALISVLTVLALVRDLPKLIHLNSDQGFKDWDRSHKGPQIELYIEKLAEKEMEIQALKSTIDNINRKEE